MFSIRKKFARGIAVLVTLFYIARHRSRSQAFVTRIICTEGGGFRDLNIRRDLDHFTWSFPREVTWGHEDRAPLNIHSPRV